MQIRLVGHSDGPLVQHAVSVGEDKHLVMTPISPVIDLGESGTFLAESFSFTVQPGDAPLRLVGKGLKKTKLQPQPEGIPTVDLELHSPDKLDSQPHQGFDVAAVLVNGHRLEGLTELEINSEVGKPVEVVLRLAAKSLNLSCDATVELEFQQLELPLPFPSKDEIQSAQEQFMQEHEEGFALLASLPEEEPDPTVPA